VLILISGGSCAGKTTFAAQLHRALTAQGIRSQVISTDLFYRDLPAGMSVRQHNFDAEENVDRSLMLEICRDYSSGIPPFQVFDFTTHSRSATLEIHPLSVLIVEGIFALSFPSITALPSLKIFIHTSNDKRYARRVQVYTEKLGHSREFIDFKFFQQAEPYYKSSIEPWKSKADLVIPGDEDFAPAADAVLKQYFSPDPQPEH